MTKQKFLGVDPGLNIMGWGLIEITENSYKTDYGTIKTPARLSKAKKFFKIFSEMDAILHKYNPTAISLETQYVNKNVRSAITLSMTMGIVLVVSGKHNVPAFEYTPTEIKKGITGYGNATKSQVQYMVKSILNLSDIDSYDVSDALALAILQKNRSNRCTIT